MHGISVSAWHMVATAGAYFAILTTSVYVARAEPLLAFDIDVTLSTKAAERLRATGEGISLDAFYYGAPSPAGGKHVNETGMIDLANENLDVPGQAGRVHIDGHNVTAERLTWIVKPNVNVNVFSSRKASKDNILDCDFIDGDVERVIEISPIRLHCSLISEHANTMVFP